MSTMRSAFLLIAGVLLATPPLVAQEHLAPERGSINESEGILDYHKSLQKTLLKNAPFHYRARVICFPSFKPPWALTLVCQEGDPENGEEPAYFLECVLMEDRPGLLIEETDVRTERVALDRDVAEAVQEVWLRQTRYTDRHVGGGANGVNYHFSRFVPLGTNDPKAPSGWEAGWIWTPDSDSLTGQLASLSEILKSCAIDSMGDRKQALATIRERSKRLLLALNRKEGE